MSAISLFEEKQVRRAWNAAEEKWYFSIDDVVLASTDSINVKDDMKKLRKRDPELNFYWGTNRPPVKMAGADGKQRITDVADTEQLLRLIQSVPSPKTTKLSQNPKNASPAKSPNRLPCNIQNLKNDKSYLRAHPLRQTRRRMGTAVQPVR